MSPQTAAVALEAEIRCERLQEFVSAIDAIVDEAVVRIDEDGISASAVDPANVAMAEATLSADAFESFDGREAALGVDIPRLRTVLGGYDDEALVTLRMDEEAKKLGLASGDYSYTYACIHPDSIRTEPDIPELDLSTTLEIGGDQLSHAVEYFDEFATHVDMGYSPDGNEFYMKADSDKGTDDADFRLGREDLEYVRGGESSSLFSLDYFTDLTEEIPDGRTVTVEVGQEFPMKMRFGIVPKEDSTHFHGDVVFMQAPRIQSD